MSIKVAFKAKGYRRQPHQRRTSLDRRSRGRNKPGAMSAHSVLLLPLLLAADISAAFQDWSLSSFELRTMAASAAEADGRDSADLGNPHLEAFKSRPAQQVRIEQRVTIRIMPQSAERKADGLVRSTNSVPMRVVERPLNGCVRNRWTRLLASSICSVPANRCGSHSNRASRTR